MEDRPEDSTSSKRQRVADEEEIVTSTDPRQGKPPMPDCEFRSAAG
jgi:hypothetical protein